MSDSERDSERAFTHNHSAFLHYIGTSLLYYTFNNEQ